MRNELRSEPMPSLNSVPKRDPDTIEYQLDRLRKAMTEANNRAASILAQIRGADVPADSIMAMPGTVQEALSMLAQDAEITVGDLRQLGEIIERQLGDWRLE